MTLLKSSVFIITIAPELAKTLAIALMLTWWVTKIVVDDTGFLLVRLLRISYSLSCCVCSDLRSNR